MGICVVVIATIKEILSVHHWFSVTFYPVIVTNLINHHSFFVMFTSHVSPLPSPKSLTGVNRDKCEKRTVRISLLMFYMREGISLSSNMLVALKCTPKHKGIQRQQCRQFHVKKLLCLDVFHLWKESMAPAVSVNLRTVWMTLIFSNFLLCVLTLSLFSQILCCFAISFKLKYIVGIFKSLHPLICNHFNFVVNRCYINKYDLTSHFHWKDDLKITEGHHGWTNKRTATSKIHCIFVAL